MSNDPTSIQGQITQKQAQLPGDLHSFCIAMQGKAESSFALVLQPPTNLQGCKRAESPSQKGQHLLAEPFVSWQANGNEREIINNNSNRRTPQTAAKKWSGGFSSAELHAAPIAITQPPTSLPHRRGEPSAFWWAINELTVHRDKDKNLYLQRN